MKRSFIAISVATIIGLSACSTKVSSSTSMNSPISTSVTSEQEFLSNLENASTSQILQMLKVQMSTMQNTKKAIPLATRPGIMTEKSKQPEMKNILHSFRVLLRPLLSRSCPITMHCREKRLRLFTSFKTGLFCFISRKT